MEYIKLVTAMLQLVLCLPYFWEFLQPLFHWNIYFKSIMLFPWSRCIRSPGWSRTHLTGLRGSCRPLSGSPVSARQWAMPGGPGTYPWPWLLLSRQAVAPCEDWSQTRQRPRAFAGRSGWSIQRNKKGDIQHLLNPLKFPFILTVAWTTLLTGISNDLKLHQTFIQFANGLFKAKKGSLRSWTPPACSWQ